MVYELLKALAQMLETAGAPKPVYFGANASDAKNTVVVLTGYMGTPVDTDQTTVGDIQRIQILTRAPSLQAVDELAWLAYREILKMIGRSAPLAGYLALDVLQSPSMVGRDAKQRYELSFNARFRAILPND